VGPDPPAAGGPLRRTHRQPALGRFKFGIGENALPRSSTRRSRSFDLSFTRFFASSNSASDNSFGRANRELVEIPAPAAEPAHLLRAGARAAGTDALTGRAGGRPPSGSVGSSALKIDRRLRNASKTKRRLLRGHRHLLHLPAQTGAELGRVHPASFSSLRCCGERRIPPCG